MRISDLEEKIKFGENVNNLFKTTTCENFILMHQGAVLEVRICQSKTKNWLEPEKIIRKTFDHSQMANIESKKLKLPLDIEKLKNDGWQIYIKT